MSHTSVTAVLLWVPVGSIVLFVRDPRAGQQGIMPSAFLNDLVACSFAAAEVLVTKEPVGLSTTAGKRPDGLVPWQSGKSLCLDVTVICSLDESYDN